MTHQVYSVSWNLTQRCNLQCAHCYMSAFAGADTGHELSTAECRRVIDEIAAANPDVFLILTGGDELKAIASRHPFLPSCRFRLRLEAAELLPWCGSM